MILTSKSFNVLRESLFKNGFTQSQVDALNFLVKKCSDAGFSYPECAYALATVYHETNKTMLPIKEAGSDAYLRSKKYFPYIGYGYVQLTWKANYERIGRLIGTDLIKNPEKALKPEVAVEVMTSGMLKGWFTGVGFRKNRPVTRYNKNEYIRARAIINGTDKAELIADYAMDFEKALRS